MGRILPININYARYTVDFAIFTVRSFGIYARLIDTGGVGDILLLTSNCTAEMEGNELLALTALLNYGSSSAIEAAKAMSDDYEDVLRSARELGVL